MLMHANSSPLFTVLLECFASIKQFATIKSQNQLWKIIAEIALFCTIVKT